MGLRINTNMAAMSANRALASSAEKQAKSYARLASGNRITEAGDDAAGLSISENLRSQIRSISQAERTANDGISALALIEAHIADEALCPEMIARDIGVSMRGLYRVFAKKGLVIAQYIKNRRLDICAETLRNPQSTLKLSALGYTWGFSNSSYFTTAFKQRFGVSPGEYRKRYS